MISAFISSLKDKLDTPVDPENVFLDVTQARLTMLLITLFLVWLLLVYYFEGK